MQKKGIQYHTLGTKLAKSIQSFKKESSLLSAGIFTH